MPRGRKSVEVHQLERIDLMVATVLGTTYGLVRTRNDADARIIEQGSPALAASIRQLCEQDKRVREWLFELTTGSAYVGVFAASAAIVLPILANHNLLPPLMGISPKAAASSQNTTYGSNGSVTEPASVSGLE